MRTALLALALIISVSAAPRGTTIPRCCPNYFDSKIPAHKVESCVKTSSDCPKKGFVFTTVKGKHYCVDPGQDWVMTVVDKLNKKTGATTACQL